MVRAAKRTTPAPAKKTAAKKAAKKTAAKKAAPKAAAKTAEPAPTPKEVAPTAAPVANEVVEETSGIQQKLDEVCIAHARAVYDREQERLRRKEPTRAQQKVIQDRRVAAWIKENPGKTKTDYAKHQKERYARQLAGIKAQTRFLQMRKIQKK
jgi:hypothetical protein